MPPTASKTWSQSSVFNHPTNPTTYSVFLINVPPPSIVYLRSNISHQNLKKQAAASSNQHSLPKMAASAIDEMTMELELPGFRFHPTEEELLDFYLKNMVFGKRLRFDIIGFLNIYHHDPWDLPGRYIYIYTHKSYVYINHFP